MNSKRSSIRRTFSLAILLAAGAASSKEYAPRLEFQEFSPCPGTATYCWPRLLLRGEIDSGAASRLAKVLGTKRYTAVTFDSPGGNLAEGIRIGLLLRAQGLKTELAPSYEAELPGQPDLVTIADGVTCFSACAYAFMGGVSRSLAPGSQFGVHQFYGSSAPASGAHAQVTTALLSQYMGSMGVSRDLLDIASTTASDDVSIVSREQAVRFNLDNQEPLQSPWGVLALDDGTVVAAIDQQQAGSDMTTRIRIGRLTASSWAVAVSYGPVPEYQSEMPMILQTATDEAPSFCTQNFDCIKLETVDRWHFDARSRRVSGLFTAQSAPLVNLMSRAVKIEFDTNFYKGYWDFDGNVTLGKERLQSALLAISK